MNTLSDIVTRLKATQNASDEELMALIEADEVSLLTESADAVRRAVYGDEVYLRGLIEFTNYCKNDCLYCGLRHGNKALERYRLTETEILSCCDIGYTLGFRTFVLQGGEDPYYTAERLSAFVRSIHQKYPDCRITLSVGERSEEDYRAFREAGASRYLLRHETACETHYEKLHPTSMRLSTRKKCLFALKRLGYQVGSGFMVGSPFQVTENLVEDLRFLQELQPDMIGIGPFIHQTNTPFADCPSGTLERTLRMLSILRLMFPYALLPSTTALGTIHPNGREFGLKAGANVVMPNLSPVERRKQYALYDDKLCMGDEAAECKAELEKRIAAAGYRAVNSVGDPRR